MAGLRPGDGSVAAAALERALATPDALAFLQKRYGIWQHWRWHEAAGWAGNLSRGLAAEAASERETVAIVSGQRVEAVLATLACQLIGVRPLLLHPTISPGGLAAACEEAHVTMLIAEDQEQVDKTADVSSRLPQLGRLFAIDPKGVRSYRHVTVEPLSSVVERGRSAPAVAERCRAGGAALALYSGGVLTDARLLSFRHDEVIERVRAAVGGIPLRPGVRVAAQFALADSLGHFFSIAAPALVGSVACFGEGRLLNEAELREVAPEIFVAPARVFERLRRAAIARIERAGWLRRSLFAAAMKRGADRGLWRWIVGRPLLGALGFTRATWLAAAYEQVSGASAEFFAGLGKPVRGLYAVADGGGPVAVLPSAAATDLLPLGDTSLKIDDDATLLLRARSDGDWIVTGDLASRTAAGFQLRGRASDQLMLGDGSTFAASLVERELSASTFVNQAVAVGGPATGITVLVELDETAARDLARERGIAFTTSRNLAESGFVQSLVAEAVALANLSLPAGAQVARAIVLPRPLDQANGELTASLALRRAFIRNRYAHRLVGPANP